MGQTMTLEKKDELIQQFMDERGITWGYCYRNEHRRYDVTLYRNGVETKFPYGLPQVWGRQYNLFLDAFRDLGVPEDEINRLANQIGLRDAVEE